MWYSVAQVAEMYFLHPDRLKEFASRTIVKDEHAIVNDEIHSTRVEGFVQAAKRVGIVRDTSLYIRPFPN
ncbi:MAG: hypothetical protein JWP44_4141 [Mucilaginibacter sp.]|nr:hypothetical protein [Mucilaginibacter sp.]